MSFAVKNQKQRSIELLADYVDLTQKDQRGMSILGQAIVSNDIKSFDMISSKIEGSEFLNETEIYDAKMSLKSISLIEYFCKRCQTYTNYEKEIPDILLRVHDLLISR